MEILNKIRRAGLLFLFLLLLYTLLRIGFYCIYFWGETGGANLAAVFYWGMRLDFTALFFINLPFWFYYFFLYEWLPDPIRNRTAVIVWLVLNVPFLAINFIDLAYFKFNNRRSTTDLLFVVFDSIQATGAFITDYWYLFLLFGITLAVLIITGKIVLKRTSGIKAGRWYRQYVVAVIAILIFAVIARGTATRPIIPSTPLLYFEASLQPLVSNSSLSFLYSTIKRQKQLELLNYYDAATLDSLFSIKRQYVHDKPFQQRNVVIVMLESFCSEYFEDGNALRAKTPFLDSIISQSTWCGNAYANGFSSNRGIVSILGSMPSLLDEPYYKSIYGSNKIRGLGTILKEKGYSTHFFYGAEPDHFGFGKFCHIVGIDNHHTREDFNDERYYDNNWGIYDHQFLPFAGRVLQKENDPFLAVLFNISSHPPFKLPPYFKDSFGVTSQKPYLRSAAYVDHSIQLFFNQIRNAAWFKNTLFVFCADHSIISAIKKPFVMRSALRIPIFLYDPADPVRRNISKTVQQLDVVPTILDRLSYAEPFMSFGHSIYDTTQAYAICKSSGIQMMDSSFLFRFNPEVNEPVCLYNTSVDTAMTTNLLNNSGYSSIKEKMLLYSKAFAQRYNNALIQNKLFVK
jgi:phosphoglycerol transferase MdoB-like AlkP superfamily enzyme